jgi:BirA family biotin operon repressor/biotin-[acetyl-CoA-carboxylase] ligase
MEAEPGKNLTLSVFLKPSFLACFRTLPVEYDRICSLPSVSITALSRRVHIKWPNDLYFGHKKLGGILIETSIKNNKLEEAVIGIGININQEQYSESKATSMKLISKVEYSLEKLLPQLLTSLEQ